ncbi:putative signal peptide protein, partial [Puccinia sorghi]
TKPTRTTKIITGISLLIHFPTTQCHGHLTTHRLELADRSATLKQAGSLVMTFTNHEKLFRCDKTSTFLNYYYHHIQANICLLL